MKIILGKTTFNGDIFERCGNIICECGSERFTRVPAHMDFKHKAVNCYQCTNCGKLVTATTEREMPV